jgi:hypothetical protein
MFFNGLENHWLTDYFLEKYWRCSQTQWRQLLQSQLTVTTPLCSVHRKKFSAGSLHQGSVQTLRRWMPRVLEIDCAARRDLGKPSNRVSKRDSRVLENEQRRSQYALARVAAFWWRVACIGARSARRPLWRESALNFLPSTGRKFSAGSLHQGSVQILRRWMPRILEIDRAVKWDLGKLSNCVSRRDLRVLENE